MRIHTNILTPSRLVEALDTAGLDGVYLDSYSVHGSRKRTRGIEFRLAAFEAPGRRRPRNTGNYGAESGIFAATYDEHGRWMAVLFDREPDAIIGYYNGREDFHRQTKNAYRREVVA